MYQVVEENQYNLDTRKSKQPCPLCSEERKNKKDPCLQVSWDGELGKRGAYCHHCHTHLWVDSSEWLSDKPKPTLVRKRDSAPVEYLKNRGISKSTLDNARVTCEGDNIHFNYFIGDVLVNRKVRNIKDKRMFLHKDAERICYNLNGIKDAKEVYIVEGEVDVLSFIEAGKENVISVPNGASKNSEYLNHTFHLIDKAEKVIIAVDNDEPGIQLRTELIRRFGPEKSFILEYKDCKDANEYLQKYGTQALTDHSANYIDTPVAEVIASEDLFAAYERMLLEGGLPKGYGIGIEGFDDIFTTYTGQFITVTGAPGSGKSDFVDQMCIGYNQKYDWKVAYVSPENEPYEVHLDKLMRKWMNKKVLKEDINSGAWNYFKARYENDFFHINKHESLEQVLSKAGELVRRKGIKCLVIDPYNKVLLKDRTGEVNNDTRNYLNKIDKFAKKYDVLVILVAHPVKLPKDENGDYIEPDFYSVKGGGEFFDMSYHGLCVHRPVGRSDWKSPLVNVKVLKCKFAHLGKNNANVQFNYEYLSGRYKQISEHEYETITEERTVEPDLPF